jgi:predicted NUDIX family phosphoesterase
MSDIHEKVMVIKRNALKDVGLFQGVTKTNFAPYLRRIQRDCYFIPRYVAEESPVWKQIVVYCVVQHADQVLVFQRRGHGEAANGLEDRYSIGVGGHVGLEDVNKAKQQGIDVFLTAAKREMAEELDYSAPVHGLNFQMIGLLNDDTNPIGQLHFGIVFLVALSDGLSEMNVKMQGELKDNSGFFSSISSLVPVQDRMENWSSMILNCNLLAG